ncbi:MAG: hypothetical protein ABI680_12425 [Chthoniobacteraceae bacterium]
MKKRPRRRIPGSPAQPLPESPPSEQTTASQRSAALWFVLAILPFLIGFLWLSNVFRTGALWLHRHDYIPSELEVQTVEYESGESIGSGARLAGVITHGGESVRADMSGFNVMIFDGKYDASGRLPTLGEIKGKRLPVWYRPPPAGGDAFWMPVRVFSMNEFPKLPGVGAVLGHVGFCTAMFVLCFFCVRRCVRIERGEVKPKPSAWPWYFWPGVALLLVTGFFYWVLIEVVLAPHLSSDGARQIERTAREKFIAATAIVTFSMLPLGSLYVVARAVRRRFTAPGKRDEFFPESLSRD